MNHYEKPAIATIEYFHSNKLTKRKMYLSRAAGTLFNLVTDLAIGPIARQEKLNPASLFKGGFEEQPAKIKESVRTQANLLLQIALGQANGAA